MGFFKEFKEFALKGSVVDMAVGIIIGAAVGKVVTSLVNDIIMPPVGMLLGGVDFKNLQVVLKPDVPAKPGVAADAVRNIAEVPAVAEIPAVAVRYGAFIGTLIDFLIMALAIFVAIKVMNTLSKHVGDRVLRRGHADSKEATKP